MTQDQEHLIILFDGVCNLCNSSVNFLIDRDPKDKFRFASLQSDKGKEFLSNFKISSQSPDSIVVIDGNQFFIQSDAILRISKEMKFPYSLLSKFGIVPKFFRDFFYDLIAFSRYKVFGKKEFCRILTPDLKKKFLDM
ncbi:MAG: DUF393 domain-containing protein [Leptospiraceae bacterium]|nr:DUF393 domain-containing protein [Leptospiraceae bacterium]MCP5513538.1 DUF393 domain-containing protein [Leptospiraceae bacterium]